MSPADIKNFLVIYDIAEQSADVQPFGSDYDAALAAYERAEREHHDDPNVEVVLFGSDSEETLQRTHGSYFELAGKHVDEIVSRELAEWWTAGSGSERETAGSER
jgi:hypothetical protein